MLFVLIPAAIIGQNVTEQEKRKKQIEEEIAFLDLRSNLGELKKDYSKLIYTAYKNRDQKAWFMYVLASENINQGFRRWAYFKEFNRTMQNSASQINNANSKITNEVGELEKMKLSSLKVQTQKSQEFKKLQTDEQGAKKTISQLTQKEKEVLSQLKAKRREVERLNNEIERILSQAVKAKTSPDYKESTADRQLSDKFEQNRGRLPWPVKRGAIVDEFGQHFHPVFKNIKLPFNNGVNIETDLNAEVFSVFDGVVKQVLVMPGYNQCVLIQHGNYYTFYCKLDKVSVRAGDRVKTGQSLGRLVSSDENSSVIHFQLWNGTDKQNPESWISR